MPLNGFELYLSLVQGQQALKSPLDVSIFSPLKKALATETDKVTSLNLGRQLRVEWTKAYIRVREKAIT
ncbi:MAG: hypothetical protein FE78DRAFT_29222 [Acidomyces sp. 'richmondensis']|nr:MAG: hypothetical protein FE78DRAFT_29222 [Acidomyces sp. 'richmondensis']